MGPTFGGFPIAAIGNIGAMWIAALAFLPTLLIFWRMPPVYDVIGGERTPLTVGNVMREIGEGFRYLWDQPVLRWLVVVMSLANLGGVGMRTLLLYVLREEHHLDEVTIGLALSVSSIGLVVGSFIGAR